MAARPFFFGVKRGAKRAHESRDARPDHRMAQLAFKRPQNRIV
jgi:hypothetical protein